MESVHQGTDAAGQPPLRKKWINKLCWWLQRFYCNSIQLGSNPPYHGRLMFKFNLCWCTRGSKSPSRGAPRAVLSQRKTLSTQLINSLIYIHSGFSMHHLKEVENCGGKLEEERDKTIYFVHGLAGDTVFCWEKTADFSASLQAIWIYSKYKNRFLF